MKDQRCPLKTEDMTVKQARELVFDDDEFVKYVTRHDECPNYDKFSTEKFWWDTRDGHTQDDFDDEVENAGLTNRHQVRVEHADTDEYQDYSEMRKQEKRERKQKEKRMKETFEKDFGFVTTVKNSLTTNRYQKQIDADNNIVRSRASLSERKPFTGDWSYTEIDDDEVAEYRSKYESITE